MTTVWVHTSHILIIRMNAEILACTPVLKEKQLALGIVSHTPGPGHEQTACSKCGTPVYIGPRGRELVKAHPATEVMCFACALPHGKAGSPVRSLGGTGGSYLVQ